MQLKHKFRSMLLEAAKLPNQEEIDRVLDKISAQGYESLSPEEKEVLNNPDAEPEKTPYVDPYEEDELDMEEMDEFVGSLQLKKNIERRWGDRLEVEEDDFAINTENGVHKFKLKLFYDDRGVNVCNYHKETKGLQIDKSEYAILMKNVNIKTGEEIQRVFTEYMEIYWNVQVARIVFEKLNDLE
jgi:hypothetical protein